MKTNKMRFNRLLALICVFALVFVFAGCKSKKEKPQSQKTEFEQGMTAKDTLAVKELVDKFFSYAKSKNFDEAAAMLYRNDLDKKGEPQQLDNEEMAEVKTMLESIPMVDYKIEYIKFDEYYANEVLCHVIIKKAEGDMPDITTKMFFKPVDYMGNWVLCLTNTEYGDKGVVRPDKRDSVERAYRKQQKADSEKK